MAPVISVMWSHPVTPGHTWTHPVTPVTLTHRGNDARHLCDVVDAQAQDGQLVDLKHERGVGLRRGLTLLGGRGLVWVRLLNLECRQGQVEGGGSVSGLRV